MLKSLLFSLTLMLCLAYSSPLTRAAEDVRPEQTTSAESNASTEALYKTLIQRLDTIKGQIKAKQHIDDALKEFDAQTQGQVTLLSTGFTILGVVATVVGLLSIVITYITGQTYIQNIRLHEAELKNIVKEARKHRKTLRELVAEHSPSEKFAAPVLAKAREAAEQGVGTEVLWGKAILAQEAEHWQKALTYWQGVLETFPKDDTALFGASLAALQLSEEAKGEEQQRMWQLAETYFKRFPEAQLTVAVLGNWGNLCAQRGEYAPDNSERERWFDEAEEMYRKATQANPNHANNWGNWGNLCVQRGNAATDNSERERWFDKAEEKYRKATEADPSHADSWYNWGNLCVRRGFATPDNNERERWFDKAEEKYRKATEADPNHANGWYNWGLLKLLQDKAASDADTRARLYTEAERKFDKALGINPRHAGCWFNKARLASLRQDVKACVDALEQWRACDSNATTARLDNDPDFDNVRNTPEFQAFRKKLADSK